MAGAVQPGVLETQKNHALSGALKDAGITAFIAMVLFGSLVGFKTESVQEALALNYRWGWAIGLAAGAAAIRLFLDLFFWRKVIAPGEFREFLPNIGGARLVWAALALLYGLGGLFFLVSGARPSAIAGIANLLAWTPEWRGRFFTAADLITFASMAVFIVSSAMLLARLIRWGWQGLFGGRAQRIAKEPAGGGFLHEMGKEFAPALLIIAVCLPLLVLGPQQRYALDTAMQVLTYIMLGWGLNVVVGLAGLLDLGYVAFYAVGAYSYALIATEFGWSFWVCLPLAGLFAAFWGVLLGFPVLRLRGDYLAIVTLAFGEIIRIVLLSWYSLTNGPNGISRIPKLTFFGLPFERTGENTFHGFFGIEFNPIHRIVFLYYVILVLALITNFITIRLRKLPIGRAWEALREDEIACRSLGINTVSTKLTAFATGAMFAGFAGSFFATRQGFISPESFTFQESALVLAIVVLGGLGSQLGVVIAAVALIGSSELFRELEQYRMLMFGACMVAIMLWRPRGLIATRTPSLVLRERKPIPAGAVHEGKA